MQLPDVRRLLWSLSRRRHGAPRAIQGMDDLLVRCMPLMLAIDHDWWSLGDLGNGSIEWEWRNQATDDTRWWIIDAKPDGTYGVASSYDERDREDVTIDALLYEIRQVLGGATHGALYT